MLDRNRVASLDLLYSLDDDHNHHADKTETNFQSLLGWPSMTSLLATHDESPQTHSNNINPGLGLSRLQSLSSAALHELQTMEENNVSNSNTDHIQSIAGNKRQLNDEEHKDEETVIKRQLTKDIRSPNPHGHGDEDVGFSLEDDSWNVPVKTELNTNTNATVNPNEAIIKAAQMNNSNLVGIKSTIPHNSSVENFW